jgi:hypothetical protein
MSYETRLLMYADILGWTTELSIGDDSKARVAMECIYAASSFHDEYARPKTIRREASGKFQANPLYLGVQFGAFSDHFGYSTPANFGGRISDTRLTLPAVYCNCAYRPRCAGVGTARAL